MSNHIPFKDAAVEQKFLHYPANVLPKMIALRDLIYQTAATLPGVGLLEETLKWGEPSYLTSVTKSGSTIRIDWKAKTPDQYYIYVNCKTTLVDQYKEIYANELVFQGNRAIVLQLDEDLNTSIIKDCIAMALTYHLHK